jgi:hypothetical protein
MPITVFYKIAVGKTVAPPGDDGERQTREDMVPTVGSLKGRR